MHHHEQSVEIIDNDTGLMALPRSPLHGTAEVEEMDASDVVDNSLLPPG